MLIVRATKKLAQRLGEFDDVPAEPDLPLLGEWYATVIFWRPQVALFVSEITWLPVFVPLAPPSSVTRRLPAELADVLRRQEVPGAFIDKQLSKMNEAVCLPTASRSMLGVLNEYVHARGEPQDLAWLEDWLAQTHRWVRSTSGTASPTGNSLRWPQGRRRAPPQAGCPPRGRVARLDEEQRSCLARLISPRRNERLLRCAWR